MMTENRASGSSRERTCVGCATKSAPEVMVRLVLGPEGDVAVDAAGGGFGRGAHVHPSRECLERACKGGLSRAFKREVKMDANVLSANVRDAYERRAIGMLMGARRAGHLVLGADAAHDAVEAGAPLVVIAADAGKVAARFEHAISSGRAASFGTKVALGEMFGTGETAVFAVRHAGVAKAFKDALAMRSEER